MANNILSGQIVITAPGVQQAFNGVNQSVQKTQAQLNSLAPAVQKSNQNFLNFGRVIQDLPFGIQGIQNNLTQLIPAAGALGLVFTGLVTALTFAQVGFGAWTRGLGTSSKKIDEAKEKIKELIKSIDDIKDAASGESQGEIALVNTLANAVLDQTNSYKERNNALNQLKDINKNYFGDLTLESSKLATLKGLVDDYTQALIAASVVKAFGEEIGKVAVELSKQEREYNKLGAAVVGFEKTAKEALKGVNADAEGVMISPALNRAEKALSQTNRAFAEQGKIVGSLRNQMFNLNTEMRDAVKNSLNFKPLTSPGGAKPVKIKVEAEIERLRFTTPIAPLQFPGTDDPFAEIRKKFASIFDTGDSALGRSFSSFISEKVKEANKLIGTISDDTRNAASMVSDTLTPAFQNLFSAIIEGGNPLKAFFDSIIQGINQLISKLIAAAIQAAVLSAFSGGTSSFGTLFGKALGFGGGARPNIGFSAGSSVVRHEIFGRLEGRDIVLSGARTIASNGRIG